MGPLSLGPLAAALGARGWHAAVPDLRPALAVPPPQWPMIIDLVTETGTTWDAVIGHSGAGVVLPLLAERLAPRAVAFVDAVVPGEGAEHHVSTALIEFIDGLPQDDGLLPLWTEWWGDAAMADLVPDATLRRRLAADTPRVPRSFYDQAVPLPSQWMHRGGCCYLQLSPAYADDRARAEAWGWPTAGFDGQHLDTAVRPNEVADVLADLLEQVLTRR